MKKRLITFILAITMLIPNIALGQAELEKKSEADILFFSEVLNYIENNYPFETDESQLIESGLKGMLQSIDPYSNYYTAEEAEDIYSDMTGRFAGIGVYMRQKEDYLLVMDTMKGHPADKAGIKKDDIIISVDNLDIKGLDISKVSKLIKGPKGTDVIIGVKRGDKLLKFKVKREEIKVNPVESKVLENNIGYIEFREFNSQGVKEMEKVLNEFDNKGIKKLILDIRNNPGGQLNQAIEISKLFVTKGPIVHIREKNKALLTYVSKLEKPKYDLVVLVNENSASASEILAGAIKDSKSGTLVGTKTFGKGLVQGLISIKGGGILKLTIAEYLTPNKTSINGIGIEPDVKVENTNLDLQMEKAMEILNNR